MSEKKPFVPKGTYIIVINRGDMQALFPIQKDDLLQIKGAHMATAAVMQFLQLQAMTPRKAVIPVDSKSRQQMALQYLNGEYLRADISLASQFEGKWQHEEVPEQFRSEYTGQAPFIELNLVDTPIILAR